MPKDSEIQGTESANNGLQLRMLRPGISEIKRGVNNCRICVISRTHSVMNGEGAARDADGALALPSPK